MRKRGQAALEFLMTYGWAILVVLVVIGALAYFGVLNPSILLPAKCTIGPGLNCKDFLVSSDSDGAGNSMIRFNFENGLGADIVLTDMSIEGVGNNAFGSACAALNLTSTDCGGLVLSGANCINDSVTNATAGIRLLNGEAATISIPESTGCEVTSFGGKSKATFEITYYRGDSDSTFLKTLQGELLTSDEGS